MADPKGRSVARDEAMKALEEMVSQFRYSSFLGRETAQYKAVEAAEEVLRAFKAEPKEDLGMLVLTRRYDEGILIDGRIAIRFEKKSANSIKCTIFAPRSLAIDRLECTNFQLPRRGQ